MRAVNHFVSVFLRSVLKEMKRLGINQTELARRLNVSRPYVNRILKGDVNITFAAAARLAKALEMDFFPELRKRESKPVVQPTLNVAGV